MPNRGCLRVDYTTWWYSQMFVIKRRNWYAVANKEFLYKMNMPYKCRLLKEIQLLIIVLWFALNQRGEWCINGLRIHRENKEAINVQLIGLASTLSFCCQRIIYHLLRPNNRSILGVSFAYQSDIFLFLRQEHSVMYFSFFSVLFDLWQI